MAHTYATIAQANEALRTGGATTFASESAAIVARKLAVLEACSRRVDAFCQRSQFGSGFGPRIGTNHYDAMAQPCVRLRDDLLAVTTITLLDGTAGSSLGTPVADTDYYLRDGAGHYDNPPYREFLLHGQGTISLVGTGYRVASFLCKWGYQDVRVTSASVTTEALDTSETGVDVTAGTDFSPGNTILIESEQLYVKSISSNTLTVTRGVNGTTAASHSTSAAIDVYTYPASVLDVTLRLWERRWKGPDGGEDGGQAASIVIREGEEKILRRGVWDLALPTPY